jgi:hypothetical protein
MIFRNRTINHIECCGPFANSPKTKFKHLSKQMLYLGTTSTQTKAIQKSFYESKQVMASYKYT